MKKKQKRMNRKAVEWHTLLMLMLGMAMLLIVLYIIIILKSGSESIASQIFRLMRGG